MTNEQVIAEFLRPPDQGGAYTDEKLAALLAHAEDGKLRYWSCSCLMGVSGAQHALQEDYPDPFEWGDLLKNHPHTRGAGIEAAKEASNAYCFLAQTDVERRALLIPLIRAEMAKREAERESQTEVTELVTV